MIKVETISLLLLLILVTLLELLFQNSQIEYLIGIRFSYIITLLFFFNQKYQLGIIYLIISSIFLELILFHTLGIAIFAFSVSTFIVNLILNKIIRIKVEDIRYLTSILVLVISPVLAKVLFNIIDKEDVAISVGAIVLNVLIFYFGTHIVSKGGRRISVYKE